ncbi:DUF3368 domain-containing protein [bacterium]|nr:DUF3368 domain-containing protein [bacterium]
MGIRAIFNTSPLIFLTKLELLEETLLLFESSLITGEVLEEISARKDNVGDIITRLIRNGRLNLLEIDNKGLFIALNRILGKGESSVITLALEKGDLYTYVILDDHTARKTAIRFGLKVKGTLGIVRRLYELNRLSLSASQLYIKLQNIGFRVKEEIFREIFKEYL